MGDGKGRGGVGGQSHTGLVDRGRKNVIGVMVNAVNYEAAVESIVEAAQAGRPLAATALAVHGVMTGHLDDEQRLRLNQLDLVVPDGQPVRWALNALYRTGLTDRVYGPTLMLEVCQAAAQAGLGIFLYGSTEAILDGLQRSLRARIPDLDIAGAEPSRFRPLTLDEKAEVAARIRGSGARIVFVGLGCPRQEVWAYEYREALGMPIVAVGAAFAFHAGTLAQAPRWMQDRGLEWLFRLGTEPLRLWQRYLLLNPWYVWLVAAQLLGLRRFVVESSRPVRELSYG
jgi:N-acetylglucosaminyldiphosphoundecaprenol N-acetyl-beta-D-mannosaminyltransferase